ncbi:PREDICTED: uncharacterized protein LOC104809747 [Tarenaya hassleriana]|uniref:uncharacterized protein LOC104809747 n=1 Tax=Tarenaya hassleriana TaxID=28532 RepID=UPI00053C995E|nr:PREDICTED: uncharacterized protein LOC104809747 [Tarenaya hassleriana]
MPSTLFIALQCCQCSTMQVKQQKKSSNKWVCVICNQKQSVRKIFAQGYKAKELRFFVQSFNMSRKSLEEEDTAAGGTLSEIHVDWKKRRTDWTEYLDLDPPNRCRRSPEDGEAKEGMDAEIVTEMPKDMFKKPRLNTYSSGGGGSSMDAEDGNEPYNPIFSRKSIIEQRQCSGKASKREHELKQRNLVRGGVANSASKWNAYLTQGEEERAPPGLGRREGLDHDDAREWSRVILGISMGDQTVDDEVHPDFK